MEESAVKYLLFMVEQERNEIGFKLKKSTNTRAKRVSVTQLFRFSVWQYFSTTTTRCSNSENSFHKILFTHTRAHTHMISLYHALSFPLSYKHIYNINRIISSLMPYVVTLLHSVETIPLKRLFIYFFYKRKKNIYYFLFICVMLFSKKYRIANRFVFIKQNVINWQSTVFFFSKFSSLTP